MKTKKESNEIKEEVEKFDKKLHELTEEELEQVTGGVGGVKPGGLVGVGAICGILLAHTSDGDLSHLGGGGN